MSRRLRERSRTWFSNQVPNKEEESKEEEMVTGQHGQRYEILLKRCCCFFHPYIAFCSISISRRISDKKRQFPFSNCDCHNCFQ